MEGITRAKGGFDVATTRETYRARAVLLAIGRRGTPRKLGAQGEDREKVTYPLIDPEQYRGRRVLVVGGGDSALEAAAGIAEQPGSNDAVMVCAGGILPTRFLQKAGIEVETKFGTT